MENLIQQISCNIWISAHQIWIKDAETGWDGSFNDDAYSVGAGYAEGVLGMVNLTRAACPTPVIVEIYSSKPALEMAEEYSSVAEGSIPIPSGKLRVESDTEETITLTPGTYRARMFLGNEDSCRYDYSDGANHVRIVLYQDEPTELEMIKPNDAGDDIVNEYTGSKTEAELTEMLSSELISYQCLAVVGLLRMGKLDVVQQYITNAPDAARRVFASAVWFAGEPALPVLTAWAKDPDSDIRYRITQSLEFLGGDEARAIIETLTRDEDEHVRENASYTLENFG